VIKRLFSSSIPQAVGCSIVSLQRTMSCSSLVLLPMLVFVLVSAQKSATPKSSSYFTVDANAEHTSTQNWWGDNVDNGQEPTTAMPPNSATSSGVSPAVGAGQGVAVQVAGVLPVEAATVTGVPDTSSSVMAADDGNSTQSFASAPVVGTSAVLLMVYAVLN